MAVLAAAAPFLAAAGTVVSTIGAIQQGNAQQAAANYQAAQLTQQAGQDRATAQRQAIEERRKAGLALSRVQAFSAASGAGATDPTVNNIAGDIAGQGEYNALTQLYNGEERARGLENQASATRFQGQQAHQAGLFKAGSTILEGGTSLMTKYGDPFTSSSSSLPWVDDVRAGRAAPNVYGSYG